MGRSATAYPCQVGHRDQHGRSPGDLGSESRMEYTCVGDVVNVAAHLRGMAQPGQTLVTQEVYDLVGEEFEFASLGEHPIRGKKQAVGLSELEH